MKTRFLRMNLDFVLEFKEPMDTVPDIRKIWLVLENAMVKSEELGSLGAVNLLPKALINGRLDFRPRGKRKGK